MFSAKNMSKSQILYLISANLSVYCQLLAKKSLWHSICLYYGKASSPASATSPASTTSQTSNNQQEY